jgi:hypothetical protein
MKHVRLLLLFAAFGFCQSTFAQQTTFEFDPTNPHAFLQKLKALPANKRDTAIKTFQEMIDVPPEIPGVSDSTIKYFHASISASMKLLIGYIKNPKQDTVLLKQQLDASTFDTNRALFYVTFEQARSKMQAEYDALVFTTEEERSQAKQQFAEAMKALEAWFADGLGKLKKEG